MGLWVVRRTRRLWSDDEKRSICVQTTAPDVSVAQVGRRYGLNANLIFKWVRDPRFAPGAAHSAAQAPCFLPVEIVDHARHEAPRRNTTEGQMVFVASELDPPAICLAKDRYPPIAKIRFHSSKGRATIRAEGRAARSSPSFVGNRPDHRPNGQQCTDGEGAERAASGRSDRRSSALRVRPRRTCHMGQISMKIMPLPGSLLLGNQHR
ncbi:Transposase IS3/IS911family [Paracoccaceae bacterium]